MAVILLLLVILARAFTSSFCSYFCEDGCATAISKGPSCFTTSPGVACLEENQCNNMSEKLRVFERHTCESPYYSEFQYKPECWTRTFMKCYPVAVIENHLETERACRGKPGVAHFCRATLKTEPPFCRLPSRRLLYTILIEQGCLKALDITKYNGCGHYCEGNILQGPQCDSNKNESDGVGCLRQCADPYLQTLSEYLQEFERVVCDNRIRTVVTKNPSCWFEVFHNCKDVVFMASSTVTDETCSKLDFYLRSCKHRLKKTRCYDIGTKIVSLLTSSNPCEAKQSPRSSTAAYFGHSHLLFGYAIYLLLIFSMSCVVS